MSATDELLENNRSYAAGFRHAGAPGSPRRGLAVVACMDARLDVGAVLGLRPGDAHVIRNAGGVITDDAIRSLLISQRLLGTREVMLIHHTECGMTTFSDEQLATQVEADTGVRPGFALGAFADIEDDVRESIARVQASPLIPHRESVRGFVYDVLTGELREILPEAG